MQLGCILPGEEKMECNSIGLPGNKVFWAVVRTGCGAIIIQELILLLIIGFTFSAYFRRGSKNLLNGNT